jgi:CrcB protein
VTFRRLLLVALGGAIGTAGRLALGVVIPDAGSLPVAVFIANVVGAFLIGVLAARIGAGRDLRVFLATGILGGFTTYSAFAVGTVQLWAHAPLLAALYAVLTLTLGVGAAVAGLRIARPRRTA